MVALTASRAECDSHVPSNGDHRVAAPSSQPLRRGRLIACGALALCAIAGDVAAAQKPKSLSIDPTSELLFKAPEVLEVELSPDGKRLAIGKEDKTGSYVTVNSWPEMKVLRTIKPGNVGAINTVRWLDDAQLAASSPMQLADRIKADVLLAHGKLDDTSDIRFAKAMQKALNKARERDVELVVYDDQGHSFDDMKSQGDFYARLLKFLHANLDRAPVAASE